MQPYIVNFGISLCKEEADSKMTFKLKLNVHDQSIYAYLK